MDWRVALVGFAILTFLEMMLGHELAVVVRGPVPEAIGGRMGHLLHSHLIRPGTA